MDQQRERARSSGGSREDDGFTLIELLVAIAILGVLVIALARIVTTFYINSATTVARLNVSHDEQIASAYFSQDVGNLGTRDQTTLVANQSLWTSFPAGACGASRGTPVVLLAWDDVAWDGTASPPAAKDTIDSAAYVVEVVSGQQELHRVFCSGPSVGVQTQASDVVIAHNLTVPLPSISCTGSGCPAGAPPTVPTSVTLTMNLKSSDPGNRDGTLQVTLSGQRRQS